MIRTCSPASVITTSPVSVITTSPPSVSSEVDEAAMVHQRDLLPDKIAEAVANNGTSDVDPSEVIFCIAAILQAQIFEDYACSEALKCIHPIFHVEVDLPSEYGGVLATVPEDILNHETANDEELRELILKGVVPTIDTIFRYVFLRAKFFPECNIMALIYVNRLTTAARLPLTMDNWRGVWLSAVVVAQKVWDDRPLRTSQFNEIVSSVPKSRLRDLESTLLTLITFSTYVKPELYFKYHFELDLLFLDITGSQFTPLPSVSAT